MIHRGEVESEEVMLRTRRREYTGDWGAGDPVEVHIVQVLVERRQEPWYVYSRPGAWRQSDPSHYYIRERDAVARLYVMGMVEICWDPSRGCKREATHIRLTPEALEHPQVLEAMWAQEAP